MSSRTVSTQLQGIATKASQGPEWAFATLAHRIDVQLLSEAYGKLNKKGAPGLSKIKLIRRARNTVDRLRWATGNVHAGLSSNGFLY